MLELKWFAKISNFAYFYTMKAQKGFVGVGVLIAILVGLVVLGGGAYYVMQQNENTAQQQVETQKTTQTTQVPNNVPSTKTQGQNTTSAATQSQTSTAGMSKYTDPDFGFSFWYPSEWSLNVSSVEPYGDHGEGWKSRSISLDRIDRKSSQLTGHCFTVRAIDVFIDNQPAKAAGILAVPVVDKSVGNIDIHAQTSGPIGSALMVGGGYSGVTLELQPQTNIVVMTEITGGPVTDVLPLAKTIVATDSSIAASVSVDKQTATINAEQQTYMINYPQQCQ